MSDVSERFVGTRVVLCPNDFLFEESFGTIISTSEDCSACLIELARSLHFEDVEYQAVVARARDEPLNLLALNEIGEKEVRAHWISEKRMAAAREFDVMSWWRGGAASTVTLKSVP